MKLVSADEQAAYLSQGGIKAVVTQTGALLQQINLLSQPKPAETYFSDRFVTMDP
jgi:hypothetical protein